MNNSPRPSVKKVFILAAIVVPVVILSLITIGYSGLAGINAENQDKTFVYSNFSVQQAESIKALSVYAIAPLALLTGLLATLNLKFAKQFLNLMVLLLCVTLLGWVFFASWAIGGHYIAMSNNTDHADRVHPLNLQ